MNALMKTVDYNNNLTLGYLGAQGVGYAILAGLTGEVEPEAATVYCVSNIALRHFAMTLMSDQKGQTVILALLAAHVIAVRGGEWIANKAGYKFELNNAMALSFYASVVGATVDLLNTK